MTKKEYIEMKFDSYTILHKQLISQRQNIATDAKILIQDIFKDSLNRTFKELTYHLEILFNKAHRTEIQIESIVKILTAYKIMIKEENNDKKRD